LLYHQLGQLALPSCNAGRLVRRRHCRRSDRLPDSVTRKDGDLAHWSWRTIDGKQCWYRGARWKAKHELRWSDATPSVAGQPEIDNRVDGLGVESGRRADGPLTDHDPGPTALRSIENTPGEWGFSLGSLEGIESIPAVGETFDARYGRW